MSTPAEKKTCLLTHICLKPSSIFYVLCQNFLHTRLKRLLKLSLLSHSDVLLDWLLFKISFPVIAQTLSTFSIRVSPGFHLIGQGKGCLRTQRPLMLHLAISSISLSTSNPLNQIILLEVTQSLSWSSTSIFPWKCATLCEQRFLSLSLYLSVSLTHTSFNI